MYIIHSFMQHTVYSIWSGYAWIYKYIYVYRLCTTSFFIYYIHVYTFHEWSHADIYIYKYVNTYRIHVYIYIYRKQLYPQCYLFPKPMRMCGKRLERRPKPWIKKTFGSLVVWTNHRRNEEYPTQHTQTKTHWCHPGPSLRRPCRA